MRKLNLPLIWLCFSIQSKVKEICLSEASYWFSFFPNFSWDYFKHWKNYFNLLSDSAFRKNYSAVQITHGLHIMLRNLLILLLTLFQDKYVRTGTLVGILIGIWNPEILRIDQGKGIIILGFVGWGIGVFLGYYRNGNSQFTKNRKFKVFQGGK